MTEKPTAGRYMRVRKKAPQVLAKGLPSPHGKCGAVNKPGLAAMVIKDGVDFDALDGKPVTLMFLIAAPNTKDNVHLDVLSKLSVLMMDENFANKLRNAKSVDEFLAIIDEADKEEDAQVPMDRFDGKKVIVCQVSDGISKADQLIDQAMSGNVPVYHICFLSL